MKSSVDCSDWIFHCFKVIVMEGIINLKDTRPPMLQDPTPRAQLMYTPSEHMLAPTPIRPQTSYICKRDLVPPIPILIIDIFLWRCIPTWRWPIKAETCSWWIIVPTNIVVFFDCHFPDLWSTVVMEGSEMCLDLKQKIRARWRINA